MTPSEQFAVWRTEIAAEREATLEDLSAARSALQAAEAACHDARRDWAALYAFAARAVRAGGMMAAPLHSRLTHAREALTAAEGARGAGRASVRNLEQRATDLQEAVDQIDKTLAAAEVAPLRPTAESSRRRPVPVEFETIQMPLEGNAR